MESVTHQQRHPFSLLQERHHLHAHAEELVEELMISFIYGHYNIPVLSLADWNEKLLVELGRLDFLVEDDSFWSLFAF